MALQRLATIDPRKSKIVELRFFGGLSIDETAAVLGLSSRTIDREWKLAEVWLYRELTNGAGNQPLTTRITRTERQ
jgi:DNA-directed RNA polymerase specialized sigma24 family protein